MKRMFVCLAVTALVGATWAALPSDVIYSNDFTTRESAGAIPRLGETYEATPYRTNSGWLHPYLTDGNVRAAAAECLSLNGYYGYTSFAASYWVNSGDSRPSYDGWFQPNFSTGTSSGNDNLFRHTACLYMDVAEDGTANPCFRFGYNPGSGARRTGIALKSLHNVFTNGQLQIQVDVKMPGKWSANNAQFWVFPVHDKFMSIEAWGGVPTAITNGATLGMFGCRSGGDLTKPYLQYWNAHGNTQFGNNYSGSKRMIWSRYTVTYDLDTGKMTGTCQGLDAWIEADIYTNVTKYSAIAHPTFDTVPNSLKTYTNVGQEHFFLGCASVADLARIWSERGGISGIGTFVGLVGNGANAGTNLEGGITAAAINKPLLDNIRVSWKAPGTDEFVVAYEDDFSNRTYRVLSAPDAETTATYTAGTETVGPTLDTFTGYVKGTVSGHEDGYNKYQLTPPAKSPYATTLQPLGVDGWRRLVPHASAPGGRPWTRKNYDGGEGGNLMEIGASGSFGCFAQLIGEEVRSGKVRISVDAHAPGAFTTDFGLLSQARQRVAVALGPKALHSSLTSEIAGNTVAGGGFYLEKADDGATNHVAFTYGADAALVEDRSVEVEPHAWYRLDLVADLDGKTYDLTVTPLGMLAVASDFEPETNAVMAATGIPFAAETADGIGAFYLWGYGYGGTVEWSQARRVAFDNVKVWSIVTNGETAVTNLLYSNDFDTRTRRLASSARASGRLAYQYDRDDGQDHWIRQNGAGAGVYGADATVRDDGGNQFLSLGRETGDGHTARYTTSLGQSVASGRVTLTADFRPPEYWFGRTGGSVTVSLGNKLMEQSQVKNFAAGYLLRFGFRDSTGTGNGGRYDDIRPFVLCSADGTAVGTGAGTYAYLGDAVSGAAQKWYRFVVKADLDGGTFDAAVYDMGTAHPAPRSATGAQIGRVAGLKLMNPLGDGLSSLDVACYGVTSTFGETGVDPLHALIDNISVAKTAGFAIIIR